MKNVSSPTGTGGRLLQSLVLALSLSVAGACAGELENPPFGSGQGGGAGTTGVGGGTAGTATTAGTTGNPVCDEAIARLTSTAAVPKVGCANDACHNPVNPYVTLRGGLNLLPDPAAAMRGKLATYVDVLDPEACPVTPEPLLDPANLEGSLFIKKIRGTQSCGQRMPNLPPIYTTEEITCMENWARNLQ